MKTTQCSVEGCDRHGGRLRRGMCRVHYDRLRTRGTIDLPTIVDRLAAGVAAMPDGCIEWTGAVDRRGYGRLQRGSRGMGVVMTHRLAWELANGPIPEGAWVLHRCDNPPCCQTNPTDAYPEGHLFLGTHADNMADMVAKGRQWNKQKTHCPQGHPYDEANTYVIPSRPNARYCRTCKRARRLLKIRSTQ